MTRVWHGLARTGREGRTMTEWEGLAMTGKREGLSLRAERGNPCGHEVMDCHVASLLAVTVTFMTW